jgi:hypothetical protein
MRSYSVVREGYGLMFLDRAKSACSVSLVLGSLVRSMVRRIPTSIGLLYASNIPSFMPWSTRSIRPRTTAGTGLSNSKFSNKYMLSSNSVLPHFKHGPSTVHPGISGSSTRSRWCSRDSRYNPHREHNWQFFVQSCPSPRFLPHVAQMQPRQSWLLFLLHPHIAQTQPRQSWPLSLFPLHVLQTQPTQLCSLPLL